MIQSNHLSLRLRAAGTQSDSASAPAWPWSPVVVLSLAVVLIGLDASAVNVALPAMKASTLRGDLNHLVWVNNAYVLCYSVSVLPAGRLGDRIGAKGVFEAGLVLFTAASLACALADMPRY